MAATAKELFQIFNSSGQLVSGLTIFARPSSGAADIPLTEPDSVNYPGHYILIGATDNYDLYIGGVKNTAISPFLHVDSSSLPTPIAYNTDYFGDGSDGSYVLDGTQATVSGLFTKDSSIHYTLSRDAYFQNLTVNDGGIVLATNGFKLHCKGTLTVLGNIDNSGPAGNAGAAASGATPGGGGSASSFAATNYLVCPGSGSATGGGGATTGNGSQPSAPSTVSAAYGAAGGAGGPGGGSGAGTTGGANTGGGGGAAGTLTSQAVTSGGIRNMFTAYINRVFTTNALIAFFFNGIAGSGGGGGAGGSGTSGTRGAGGGGGSAGATAGMMVIAANTLAGGGTITANGGVGGAGGAGGNASGTYGSGGGGGGGCGGSGGLIVMMTRTTSGFSGSITATGGVGGAFGPGGTGGNANGVAGSVGPNGTAGLVLQFVI